MPADKSKNEPTTTTNDDIHIFAGVIQLSNSSAIYRSSVTNNNILYSSQREIKAVVRSHNKERISIILRHTPPFSQSAYTNRNMESVSIPPVIFSIFLSVLNS